MCFIHSNRLPEISTFEACVGSRCLHCTVCHKEPVSNALHVGENMFKPIYYKGEFDVQFS